MSRKCCVWDSVSKRLVEIVASVEFCHYFPGFDTDVMIAIIIASALIRHHWTAAGVGRFAQTLNSAMLYFNFQSTTAVTNIWPNNIMNYVTGPSLTSTIAHSESLWKDKYITIMQYWDKVFLCLFWMDTYGKLFCAIKTCVIILSK